jgi:hypothetical protein
MRKLILSLVLATAVACGGDSTSPINASIAGSYKLQTINGSALPYTILQVGSDKIEFLDDQVTVNDGGTYTESGHIRTTENGVVTTETIADAGTYVRTGTAITFHSTGDNTDTPGTFNGNSITVVSDGLSAVYVKQ